MTDGTCFLCDDTHTKRGMTRHLQSCLPAEVTDGETSVTLLRIVSERRPDYWIHVAVDRTTTLARLDEFLREFWVECCNHLSSFTIDERHYERPFEEDRPAGLGPPPQSMDVLLDDILSEETDSFAYEYDFGSTTALTLEVVDTGAWDIDELERTLVADESPVPEVTVLTRNDQPERRCEACGDLADVLCQTCLQSPEDDAYFCEDCADDHDCAHLMFLPVVNSPRSGVCGYRG